MINLLSLPDDVLLAVLAYLSPEELFRCRVVCRRLRDFCLDRDLWKNLRVAQKGVIRAALTLAPFLGALTPYGTTRPPLDEVATHVFSTNCIVTELTLQIGNLNHAALAIGIILKLSGLGGVKKLNLSVACDPSETLMRLLVKVAYNINGLKALTFVHQELRPKMPADWCDRQVESCLTSLEYWSPRMDPFLELLLRTHAATLECLNFFGMRDIPMPLLAAMPRLRSLRCHHRNHLQHLIALPKLETVSFPYRDVVPAFHPSGALDFLRKAPHLRKVEFACPKVSPSAPLLALASSRSTQVVESLTVRKLPSDILEPLLPIFFRFSSLKSLALDTVPSDTFLQAISPTSLPPGLTKLAITCPHNLCFHAWLHQAPVQDLLVRNPRLHLGVTNLAHMKNGITKCTCQWCCDCHELLWASREDQSFCFSSHRRKASCPVDCFQIAEST